MVDQKAEKRGQGFGPAWKAERIERALLLAVGAALLVAGPVAAEERFITLASTTSTENSGLFEFLLPRFEAKSGIRVHVIAQGTGQALRTAQHGDADVVLVHDRAAEERFVAEGWGVDRRDVMYNDFVVVGPVADPAGVRGRKSAAEGLAAIARAGAPFVSRGDESGTHQAERRLWQAAGIDPRGASGGWYREAGAGMGATLNIASGMEGYTLADRGTWLAFRRKVGLALLLEGDPALRNPYSVIRVNPERHPHVKAADARAFADWITSPEGQAAIAAFAIDGQPLFFPDAK